MDHAPLLLKTSDVRKGSEDLKRASGAQLISFSVPFADLFLNEKKMF